MGEGDRVSGGGGWLQCSPFPAGLVILSEAKNLTIPLSHYPTIPLPHCPTSPLAHQHTNPPLKGEQL